jgi:predicted flap endonuclease-1-like 5' DNA nuclease
MLAQNKKPFIQLCFFGSLTLLAVLHMVYLIVKATDPFSPYLLSTLIGSVPLFPYFVVSLNATIILLSVTLLTLTSVIQVDTEALLYQYVIHGHQVLEAVPDAPHETAPPLLVTHEAPVSTEEATIHALNVQVQTLHSEMAQQRHDSLIQELQDITLAATAAEPKRDSTSPSLISEDRAPTSHFSLQSPLHAIKGIGPKTETALHMIGITTIGDFLVADSAWIAEHTPLTIKRVQQFQDTAYTQVSTDAQQAPSLQVITPSIAS